jgi:GTP-binding protein EngB required for normal cell division
MAAAFSSAIAWKTQAEVMGVQAEYFLGLVPLGEEDGGEESILFAFVGTSWAPWQPPCTPEGLQASSPKPGMLRVKWQEVAHATEYVVMCARDGKTEEEFQKRGRGCEAEFHDLIPGTKYALRVCALRERHGASEVSEARGHTTPREPSLAQQLVEAKMGVSHSDGRFVVSTAEAFVRKDSRGKVVVKCLDVAPGFKPRHKLGEMRDALVIILTGETGAGKSTHLNAVLNFLMGIRLEDKFRLVMVDDSAAIGTQSVTQFVTFYRVRHMPGMPVNQSVVLVDSPGYGDCRGIEADKFVTKCFASAFKELTHLNCVGIVVNSTQARLTQKAEMVIEKMLQLFHKEVSENIVPICTFADSGKPLCLAGLEKAKVHFKKYVKVQNSPFACKTRETNGRLFGALEEQKLHWQLAETGVNQFLKAAKSLPLRPLIRSCKILERRQDLHEELYMLSGALQTATATIGSMVSQLDSLATFLGNVPAEKVKVEVPKTEKVDISGQGRHVTLCMICNFTCHDNCFFANDADKAKCCAMGTDGHCTVCPRKCHWKNHHNASYIWKTTHSTEWVVPKELIEKWAGKGGTIESAILNALGKVATVQQDSNRHLQAMIKIQQKLENESLRHNPGVMLAYVDSLIEEQKEKGASELMLKSLTTAKRSLHLAVKAGELQRLENVKSDVLNFIKAELERRTKLSAQARAQEESKPSGFYNTVYAKVTKTSLEQKVPQRLPKGSKFSDNLLKVGQFLKVLLADGIQS